MWVKSQTSTWKYLIGVKTHCPHWTIYPYLIFVHIFLSNIIYIKMPWCENPKSFWLCSEDKPLGICEDGFLTSSTWWKNFNEHLDSTQTNQQTNSAMKIFLETESVINEEISRAARVCTRTFIGSLAVTDRFSKPVSRRFFLDIRGYPLFISPRVFSLRV